MDISKRLLSLDVLRGFDMLFIVGLAPLIVAICNLFPGSFSNALAAQMHHVPWDGMKHHDTIFPLFLFIAGISFPFSYASQVSKGKSKKDIYLKILYRGFMLFFINLIYNGMLHLDFAHLRYTGVLTRIGFAWMFGALIFVSCKKSTRIIIATSLLIGYWLILWLIPAPDMPTGTNQFSMEGNIAGYIDRHVIPGIFYQDFFDPEGILSTIPAIVTAMLGMFTGEFVRLPESKISGHKKTIIMLIGTAIMLGIGLLWGKVFPINKSLWSSSFVLVVGAYSLGMFSIFYWIIDVMGWTKWTFFFRIVGLNSITVYIAQRIINFRYTNHFFFEGFANLFNEQIANAILDAGYLFFIWIFLYFLYKKNIFLKV